MPTDPRPPPRHRRRARFAALGLGVAVVATLAGMGAWQAVREHDAQARSVEAGTRFDARCRSAGDERRDDATSSGADALVWIARPLRLSGGRLSDRLRLDDRYGPGCSFEACIAGLLRVSFGEASNPEEAAQHAEGFRFVEALDPRDLGRYRYQAGIGVVHWLTGDEIDHALNATGEYPGLAIYGFVVQREEIDAFSAPYGIAWDDISTQEDRAYGIAGSALTVLDVRTGERIGRRIGFTLGAPPDGGPADATGRASTRASCPSTASSDPRRRGSADRDFALGLLR